MCFVAADECIDCAVCEAACPVGAIYRDVDLPREIAAFREINQLYFTDKDAARQRVDAAAD